MSKFELVYLWIEKYKNIENQGFKLNPNFECSYINEVLRIEENSHYSIFDDINIIALVGQNGAGKSSIQKIIFFLFFLKKYENLKNKNVIDLEKKDAIVEIFRNNLYINNNIFLIVKTDKGLKKISLLQIIKNYNDPDINLFKPRYRDCPIKRQYEELESNEVNFFSIHFNYMIDSWFDGYHTADEWILKLYHRVDGFKTPLLLEPYKGHNQDNQYIDISNIEYLNNQHLFDFYGEQINQIKFNNFFNPNYIWMMINSYKLISKFKKFEGFDISELTIGIIEEYIIKLCNDKNLLVLNKVYALIKIIYTNNRDIFIKQNITEDLRRDIINVKSNEDFKNILDQFSFYNLLKLTGINETQKLEVCIKFDIEMTKDIPKLRKYKDFLALDPENKKLTINSNAGFLIQDVRNIFDRILPWTYVEHYDNEIGYFSLSSGEKAFLNFIVNLLYQIKNIKRNGNYRIINLFFDEVEYSMHPEWQKQFLEQILNSLKYFNGIKFNLFFVTHSPFLLSDLPKENIIFLKDGEQINVNIDTFGANIHTILSHGFFMNNGLMGEFAKEKINETIENLHGDLSSLSKTQIKSIIEIVGEPFLKLKLKQMYDEKFGIDDELEELEKQQQQLNLKIDLLKKQRQDNVRS